MTRIGLLTHLKADEELWNQLVRHIGMQAIQIYDAGIDVAWDDLAEHVLDATLAAYSEHPSGDREQ